MAETYDILIKFMERAALLIICIFIITRIQYFRNIFQKENYTKKDLTIISVIFSIFSVAGTYTGLRVEGSLVNVRIVTIISGGIMFGPIVGITSGVVSGIHRYLIDINGITSLPCLISSVTAGITSGLINTRLKKKYKWIAGIITGMLCETLTMVLIVVFARPYSMGIDIISKLQFP